MLLTLVVPLAERLSNGVLLDVAAMFGVGFKSDVMLGSRVHVRHLMIYVMVHITHKLCGEADRHVSDVRMAMDYVNYLDNLPLKSDRY